MVWISNLTPAMESIESTQQWDPIDMDMQEHRRALLLEQVQEWLEMGWL